jgi:hypothetical protein
MGKCKNCGDETKKNNVYCSYKCRNIYVNKNLRDYSKNGESLSKKQEKKYNNDPKYCKSCGNKITYKNRYNSYCKKECIPYNENRKGIKYELSNEGKQSLIESAIKHFHNGDKYKENKIEYYSNVKRCPNCNKMLPFNKRTNTYCNIDCKNEFFRKNRTEMENYKKDCQFKFALNDYPNEFNFSLIEKYGWYKAKNRGDNLNGVSRDHMYSIMEGFRNDIDPKLISHPANCKLMCHNKNVSKNDKCSISIEELKEKINEWNEKYVSVM